MSDNFHSANEPFAISEANCKEINHWCSKYPPEEKRSAVGPSLLLIQGQNGGWLSVEAMDAVADYLGLAKIQVYEVATFYDMFELKPVGKNKISVCTNVSCMLRGSDDIVAYLKERFGVGMGETSADGKFTLREWECLASCGTAPVCQVNDKEYHENLTREKMAEIVDQLERETN